MLADLGDSAIRPCRYASAGRKADSHAEATDRYRTLEETLACLIEDCGVQGLTAQHDERDLFDGP